MLNSRRALITGNCLGGVLEQIVRELRSITRCSLEIMYVRNYQNEINNNAKEAVEFARTSDLYIRQVGQGLSDPLAEHVPASARQFRYPAVRLNFLWPFATRAHPKAFWEPPFIDNGIFNVYVSDAQLANIVETEKDADEAFRRFMAIDPLKLTNVDRLYEMTKQQFLANERDSDFGFWPQIEKRFRSERLFWDAGHPAWPFFSEIIDPLMDFLRLGDDRTIKSALRSRLDGLAILRNHDAPIHPRVAEHFQLKWWRPDLRYRLDHDGYYTYEEWIRRYIDFQFDRRLYTGYRHTFRGGGDRATGERDLREAVSADPGNMQARYYLGANLLFQGRPKEAILESDVAAGDPDVCDIARFQACRAETLLQLKKASEAIAVANAAIGLVPASSYYHRLLGRSFRANRQFEEARAAFSEAVRLDAYDAEGWIELGDEYQRTGNQADAAWCYQRAQELAPNDQDLALKLTKALEASMKVSKNV